MKYILCFGNPYLKEDSLAQKLAKEMKLKGFEFVSCNSPEEIMFYLGRDFMILDVAKGIRKPMVIGDLRTLEQSKIVSLHDFDLAFFLKVMKKLGKKRKIKIIALPEKMIVAEAGKKLKKIVDSL